MNVFELIKEKLEEYQENNTQNKSSDDYELGQFNACDYAIDVIDEVAQEYKQGNCTNDCAHFDNAVQYGYNKAIDEFAERLQLKIMTEIDDCADELDWIDEIAEQLRGGSDDR